MRNIIFKQFHVKIKLKMYLYMLKKIYFKNLVSILRFTDAAIV